MNTQTTMSSRKIELTLRGAACIVCATGIWWGFVAVGMGRSQLALSAVWIATGIGLAFHINVARLIARPFCFVYACGGVFWIMRYLFYLYLERPHHSHVFCWPFMSWCALTPFLIWVLAVLGRTEVKALFSKQGAPTKSQQAPDIQA